MKKVIVRKDGWNTGALLFGPFWFLAKGLYLKGIMLIILCVCTFGIAIIPVWIYCGYNGNRDFYQHLKRKNVFIHYDP